MNAPVEPSMGELLGALAKDSGTLVRQELALAGAEMTGKARTAGRQLAWIGAGGALLHAGLVTLIAAAVVGLSSWVAPWLSALVIGAAVLATGYAVVRAGMLALQHVDPIPQQAVQSLKDNSVWAKEQLHEQRR